MLPLKVFEKLLKSVESSSPTRFRLILSVDVILIFPRKIMQKNNQVCSCTKTAGATQFPVNGKFPTIPSNATRTLQHFSQRPQSIQTIYSSLANRALPFVTATPSFLAFSTISKRFFAPTAEATVSTVRDTWRDTNFCGVCAVVH